MKQYVVSFTQRIRRILGFLHLWIGLILALPLILIGLSGTYLVISHEWRDLTAQWNKQPADSVAPVEGQRQTLDAIIAAASKSVSAQFQPAMLIWRNGPDGLVSIRFSPRIALVQGRPNEGTRPAQGRAPSGGGGGFSGPQLSIDPYNLKVTETGGNNISGLNRVIHQFHANLMIPQEMGGRTMVGVLGCAMLFFGVSGLILWWPSSRRWRAAFLVKSGARGFRLHRDLHGAAGIWCLLVFLLVSFSGTYLAFPQILTPIMTKWMTARDIRSEMAAVRITPGEIGQQRTWQSLVDTGLATVPGADLLGLTLPQLPDQPARMVLLPRGQDDHAPSISLLLDPWSGTIVKRYDPEDFTIGELIMAWQRPLHAGVGLGPIWTILVGLSGLLPLLFAITGYGMWLKKRAVRNRRILADGHVETLGNTIGAISPEAS